MTIFGISAVTDIIQSKEEKKVSETEHFEHSKVCFEHTWTSWSETLAMLI